MSNTKKLERRDVLKLGVGGLAAGALSAGCATMASSQERKSLAAEVAPQPKPAAAPAAAKTAGTPRRVLGRTGIEVPIVSMGVMNADNPNLVRAALDGGLFLLDTAHGYQEGRNEEMLGTVLKDRKRDSFVLATKVHLSTLDRKTGLFSKQTRGEEIEEKLNISLKRLGLDRVDILHLHNQTAREGVLYEPVLRALEKAKRDGKTRFVGLSTHKNEPEVIRAAVEAKLYDVVLTSYNFRQDHHLEVQKAIAEAAQAGLGIVAMKTQAGIYWDKEKTSPINMKAALKWALRDPNVHTAIPGFTTLDQLQTDLEVLRDPTLTDEEKRSLEAPKLAGFFCQGCGECLDPCLEKLPIPELMRSFMYAHAYRNREAAQALLLELGLPESPCDDCGECPVRCAKGFDVRQRVRDIVRLREVPREFLV
ncbi:MAG TPA: aldo/keto reductase [Polyangia bacterium]|jgi:predicted aldo/keto reductase-like oxidoreductase|nr:aldo/keto reductase [Polyangia bacterium]